LYLVAALTGLWWSYDVYRDAVNRMAGVSAPVRRPRPADDANAVPVSIDIAWNTFRHEIPQATQANLNLASAAEAPLEVRYLLPDSPHPRAFGTLKIDATSGAVVEREDYAALPTGRRFVATIFPLHAGSYFGWSGRILMAFAALLLPVFTITGLWLWLLRRRHAALRHARPTAMPAQREGRDAVGGASRG
jgi:sulfite reductase (NADPH) flavoprotein alpha-component